ncbi:MAG: hypothetical protein GY940_02695 [bacterium]|nr:hypothetical protein [bacterium]
MSIKKALSPAGNLPVAVSEEEEESYWQKHLDGWLDSGITQASYCRNHDLDYRSFRSWKARLSRNPTSRSPLKLVEVKGDFTLSSPWEPCGSSFDSGSPGGSGITGAMPGIGTGGFSGIRFWCGEFCVEVDVKFSSSSLSQLVRTLQGVHIQSARDGGDCGSEGAETSGSEAVSVK